MQTTAISLSHHVAQILQDYLAAYPSETYGLRELADQLSVEPQDVFLRCNMRGHITSSALVIDQARSKMLMINHPLHDRWLHPGGHVESDCNSLWDAASEEVTQETGLEVMAPLSHFSRRGIPLDIDTHQIIANPKRGEVAHLHHDFMFIAVSQFDFEPNPQAGDAVKEAKWMPLSALLELPGDRMKRLATKVSGVLAHTRNH